MVSLKQQEVLKAMWALGLVAGRVSVYFSR